MSKATFDEKVANEYLYTRTMIQDTISLIERHGGRVVWPLPTPEGQGCTCVNHPEFWDNQPVGQGKGDAGPWHGKSCAMHVPF